MRRGRKQKRSWRVSGGESASQEGGRAFEQGEAAAIAERYEDNVDVDHAVGDMMRGGALALAGASSISIVLAGSGHGGGERE